MAEQELEVKFYLEKPAALEARLKQLGAALVQPRIYELNLRYDLPSGELTSAKKVLRLRQDVKAHLTYKGPSEDREDVNARNEIEIEVSDFIATRHLLEALGYVVNMIYEKHRKTYTLDDLIITLDQMPFGEFAEIEGPDPEGIRACAHKLHLDWSVRCMDSYMGIFMKLKALRGFDFRDLTFANFQGLQISAQELNLQPADHE